MVNKYDKLFPQYKIAKHKGYGSFEHRQLIVKYNPSKTGAKFYRKSFNPYKSLLLSNE